jgi:hypothetical protein
MARFLAALAAAVVLGGIVRADDPTVYTPQDGTSFPVTEKDTVRVIGKGIAGADVKITVKGPAKAEEKSVVEIVKGKPLIGNTVKEFDLKPTGKGKVTVEISVTAPQPGSKPVVTKYEFEVK